VKEFTSRPHAIGVQATSGRRGGMYAHKDIAFEFAMWISPEFNIDIVRQFQRLKQQEQTAWGWSARRELSGRNDHLHTDAIKHPLIPAELTAQQGAQVCAHEADVYTCISNRGAETK